MGGDNLSERAPTLEVHRLVAAVVGLFLVIVPAITSFYDGGRLDFSVEAIFVAGGLGLPLTLIGFASSREGRGPPADLYLLAHRLLTAALLIAAFAFTLRGEATAVIMFAAAVVIMGLLLLTRAGATTDEDRQGSGATTVASEPDRGS